MHLTVDPLSSVAPYEQVRLQITALADDGTLAPGTRLPTVRSLAETLGLAANTVARAYRELEGAGVVETRGRQGTFVAASGDARERAAFEAARDYLRRARSLGLDDDAAVAWVRQACAAGPET
ncbi:GntR family transcriptional regulator [Cellulomonas sp. ATA003]|uniref:GntR family transcriptional regulator n=1 Tax=Cellulomonas sp. ATA003 TaxID=3073064 RepID=UPI002873457F|nr:GntR family transcriptional regulator [Cellulomonas sp. ATA003]WNB86667.1 GntR family transcriptional regulator [Cellulomonas sp. ATA003]